MRSAFVHDYLVHVRGGERVLDALIDLYPGAPIFTVVYDGRRMPERYGQLDVRTSFVQALPFARRLFRAYLPFYPAAVERFDLSEFELVISSSSACALGALTGPETCHICYCHTPMRTLWQDFSRTLQGELRGPLTSVLATMYLGGIRQWDRGAADRVDYFVANSLTTARRIRKYYRRPATVIHPPVDTASFHVVPETADYYLVVSQLVPYKRIDLVVEAFNRLRLPLKIAGEGSDHRRLERMAGPTVEFLGRRTDREIAELYAHCRAFIFPTLDDFGITPLEAQASGRPVIAYRAGGALESVVEGETGSFFDQQTAEALAAAVSRFVPGDFDPQAIRQHALRFDRQAFQVRMASFVQDKLGEYFGADGADTREEQRGAH